MTDKHFYFFLSSGSLEYKLQQDTTSNGQDKKVKWHSYVSSGILNWYSFFQGQFNGINK